MENKKTFIDCLSNSLGLAVNNLNPSEAYAVAQEYSQLASDSNEDYLPIIFSLLSGALTYIEQNKKDAKVLEQIKNFI